MTAATDPYRSIDLRGLYCPEPIFRTAAEIGKIQKGEILEVLADDPAAEEDIKRWAKRTGQEILEFEKEGFDLRFLIRKTG
jgi:TusA-related sulfurtransferase